MTKNSKTQLPNRGKQLRRRLLLNCALAIVFTTMVYLLIAWQSATLQNPAWMTGYLLIGSVLFLAAFNLRKKVPFLPKIGSSKMWMQLHIYVALISIGIFFGHVGFRIPNGNFEMILGALFVIVAGSGVYGLYTTRTVPKRLTALRNEVIFEKIPGRRRQLKEQARGLILNSAQTTDVLARFYVNHLAPFFEKPRTLAYNLSPSLRRSRQLVGEIESLDRYLNEPQRGISRELTELIREKEDLDYHWALQGRLKIWMFVHIGLTYSLVIAGVLHGVLAHSFGGGLR